MTRGLTELRTCGSHRIRKINPDIKQAGALRGSINIIQNTNITVYEVESQKTVNAKLWKRTKWLSEVLKEIFHHNFRES